MANGKQYADWNCAAAIMSNEWNVRREKRSDKVWTIADFHPYMTPPKKRQMTQQELVNLGKAYEAQLGHKKRK